MKITIEAKPLIVDAELPGYGVFHLRRMGAAMEAELRDRYEKIQDLINEKPDQELAEKELKLVEAKDKKALAELRATPEYRNANERRKKIDNEIYKFNSYINKKHLELWSSDDPDAMKRLREDFTMEQIKGFYGQVMEHADNE